ncbi:hypothetical protein J4455_00105 [Candidatus Woesearchaeota archaeon]|nr:hypothetical protein [Candidatus Woesearchaeota archaeon]
MVLNACLIIKDNKILVFKEGNIWNLPYIDIDDPDRVEILLKKYVKDNLGLLVDIVQIFNTYQILKNDKNINVNVYEANLVNEKLDPKNIEANFFSVDELNNNEVSETLKFVMSEL